MPLYWENGSAIIIRVLNSLDWNAMSDIPLGPSSSDEAATLLLGRYRGSYFAWCLCYQPQREAVLISHPARAAVAVPLSATVSSVWESSDAMVTGIADLAVS